MSMTESTAENLVETAQYGPSIVRARPDWPQLVYMFDTSLFERYVGSLIRLLSFASRCDSEHPCVQEELSIYRKREQKLKEHILSFQSRYIWDVAQKSIEMYVRRLSMERLKVLTLDEEAEEAIRRELFLFDLSNLTTP